jgi:hypothetical protein
MMPKAKKAQPAAVEKRGRPTSYTKELADRILARIAAGDSLRKICKPKTMPAESTVRLWATEDRNGFSAQYTRAREAQMDALAEDILEIADGEGDVNRARLRVDTRKWLMSKIAPKRFGEKRSHELSGPNGGPIQTVDLTNVSADDLERLEALFGPLAGGPGDDDEGDQGGEGEASS